MLTCKRTYSPPLIPLSPSSVQLPRAVRPQRYLLVQKSQPHTRACWHKFVQGYVSGNYWPRMSLKILCAHCAFFTSWKWLEVKIPPEQRWWYNVQLCSMKTGRVTQVRGRRCAALDLQTPGCEMVQCANSSEWCDWISLSSPVQCSCRWTLCEVIIIPSLLMYARGCYALDIRHMRIMPAEKLAEFGTFSGKFHACLVCG